ncbi:hypothetical protein AGMMS50284_4680 [Clostridia bacterium]|nr:hypothetical protein AGMMS50284_4680 [Clostridia bacterium]
MHHTARPATALKSQKDKSKNQVKCVIYYKELLTTETIKYFPKGTCLSEINIELDGTKIESVEFVDGCDGNSKGIGSLVKGMEAQHVIDRCKGIKCGKRKTSCPDQLAKALEEYLADY